MIKLKQVILNRLVLVIILLVDATKNVRLKLVEVWLAQLSNLILQPINVVSLRLHYTQHLIPVQLKQMLIAISMLIHVKEVVPPPYGQYQLLRLLVPLIMKTPPLNLRH